METYDIAIIGNRFGQQHSRRTLCQQAGGDSASRAPFAAPAPMSGIPTKMPRLRRRGGRIIRGASRCGIIDAHIDRVRWDDVVSRVFGASIRSR